MSIFLAGDVGKELFVLSGQTVFFSSEGAPVQPGHFATQASGAPFPRNPDDQECDGPFSKGALADGRFDSVSGACEDLKVGSLTSGLDRPGVDQPPQLPTFETGPFTIYKSPTQDTFHNIYKDLNTYDDLHLQSQQRAGQRIVVYKLDREHTDVDTLLGEARANEIFKKGVVVTGSAEINQVILELSKWGIDNTQEFICHFNLTHLYERLGRPILPGDLLSIYMTSPRLLQSTLNADQHNRGWESRFTRVITRVNTAIPDKLFLFQYLELMVQVEKIRFDVEQINNLEDVYELDQVPPPDNDIPEFPFTRAAQ